MMAAWRPYGQLVRLPAVFTAISNIVAACIIGSGGNFQLQDLLLLVGSSCCIYMAGMILNDCFDAEEDRLYRPQRPIPSGAVTKQRAWSLGVILLLTGVLLASLVGVQSLVISVLLVMAVLLYDGVLKQSVLGPWVMGLCRYCNWLLGLSIATLEASHLLLPLPVLLYIVALTWISRQETEAGNPAALILAGLLLLSALAVVLLLYAGGVLNNGWGILLMVPGLGFIFTRMRDVYRDFHPDRIQGLVKLMILMTIPVDALLLLSFSANYIWLALALLCLLFPGKMLARKIYIT